MRMSTPQLDITPTIQAAPGQKSALAARLESGGRFAEVVHLPPPAPDKASQTE